MADTLEKTGSDREKSLIEGAQKGNAEDFGALYDLYAQRIYRFVFLKTGTASDAEDLTHEVFLAAWRTMKGYRIGTTPFTSWLYRIASNRVIDWYRTQKKNISLDEIMAGGSLPIELVSAGGSNLVKALAHKFELQAVMGALASLSDDQQDVIIMRYVDDMTPEETGEAMGKTAGAIRLIQHRAIKQLKKMIEETHGQPIPRTTA
jgi:RNA polymerase sigma-70 factor, ECF subfamily